MSNVTMQHYLKLVSGSIVPVQRELASLTWRQDISKIEYAKAAGVVRMLINELTRLEEILHDAAR